eukprot:3758553-Amphidinium_carterae.1
MPLALDTQLQTTQVEDTHQDVEVWPLALDSQSNTTTASFMSDVELCSRVLQHDSVMRLCDAAISAYVQAEMDNDPLGLLQSPSPHRARRSRRARSSPPVRRRVMLVSCDRGETDGTPRSPSPRGRVPPPPRRHPDEESLPQSLRHRVPPPPPPPQHAARRGDLPMEKQMPVPVAKRVIAPQPPPPPDGRVTPAQPPTHMPVVKKTQAIQPRPKLVGEQRAEQDRPRSAVQQTSNAAKPATTMQQSTVQPKVTSGAAPETPETKAPNVELVYHGSFAPFHLGHLAVVEAAVRLIQTAMKTAVVTTWISLTSEKYLMKKGEIPDPVIKQYAHGPNRCSMIDAVCAASEYRIHIIPREFPSSAEMFHHVQLQTPHHVHMYLSGSDTTPKLTDKTVTVWRDPNKNLTQFSPKRLAGTAVQRTHHGISSTQVRLAIIDKDWKKVNQMCGEAVTEEARRLAATIPAAELEQGEGSESEYYEDEEEETAPSRRQYPFAEAVSTEQQIPIHTTSKAAGPQPCAANTAPATQLTDGSVQIAANPAAPAPATKVRDVLKQPKGQQPKRHPTAEAEPPIDSIQEDHAQPKSAQAVTEAAMPLSGSAGPETHMQTRASSAPPDKRKATTDTAQPAPKKSKAGGVYAAWRKQGMSPSAIITLAAELSATSCSPNVREKRASPPCVTNCACTDRCS